MRITRELVNREVEIINGTLKLVPRKVQSVSVHFENEGLVVEAINHKGTFTLGHNLKPREAYQILTGIHIFLAALE
jgi:hypothetical protein